MESNEQDRAVERLEAALGEEQRQDERFVRAADTSTEVAGYVRLQAAVDRVRAREAWIHWVDDEGFRGLNAGPFELLAERRARQLEGRGP